MNQEIQQYVRIAFYLLWGALGSYGVTVSPSHRELFISITGSLVTVAWTVWGNNLVNSLEKLKAKAGVEEVAVKVNPDLVSPEIINKATSSGITATHEDIIIPALTLTQSVGLGGLQ